MSEVRIEYTIQRVYDDDRIEEIGFGSSGHHNTIDEALHFIASDIQNQNWETTNA